MVLNIVSRDLLSILSGQGNQSFFFLDGSEAGFCTTMKF